MPFYAVALGREIGVFDSWESCKKSTTQFRGAKFKKFEHMNDAWNFVKQNQPVYSAKDLSYDPISIESERSAKLDHVEVSERSGSSRQSNNSNSEGTKTTGSVSSTVYQKTSGSYSMSATKRKLCDSAIQIFTPGPSRAFSSSSSKRCKTEDGSSSSLSVSSASAPPFKTDADGFVQVYTDGACSNNGCSDGSAKAGIGVWFNDGHPLNVSAPVTGRATNNVAELQAATVAVQMASGAGLKKLSIATDSQFTINCMTQWIQSWKRKNWKTSTGSAVINKEEVLALEKACKSLDKVKWVYTRGHIGIHGNEQADMLARNGASSYNVLEK